MRKEGKREILSTEGRDGAGGGGRGGGEERNNCFFENDKLMTRMLYLMRL